MQQVTRQAFNEAIGLGHGWVGDEHLLLALLGEHSTATDALAAHGVSYDRIIARLRETKGDPDIPDPVYDPAKGLSGPNPAGQRIIGRAEGLALAAGLSRPEPVHWLLAMIYAEGGMTSFLLRGFDVTPRLVLDELQRRGVAVPDVEPPAGPRPMRGRRRVIVDESELPAVLDALRTQHPAGSDFRWGFNWLPGEPRTARVTSEDGIDLDAIVVSVRRGDPS